MVLHEELINKRAEFEKADKEWRDKFAPLFKAQDDLATAEQKLARAASDRDAKEREKTEQTALKARLEQKMSELGDGDNAQKIGLTGQIAEAGRRIAACITSIATHTNNVASYTKARNASLPAVEREEKNLYPDLPIVTVAHVRKIFSKESGIPASSLSENQLLRLAKLDKFLDDVIFLQADAKAALSKAYREREMGVSDPRRPAGVIVFTGGTGLGKTELVKQLAKFDGGDAAEPVIIRLSEFKGKSAATKLLGADPGNVGYDDGSPFLDPIDANGRAIVLLDEADKADPTVFDILMQVLEEGKIRNSKGRLIDFKDTIIIIATNGLLAKDLSANERQDQEAICERLGHVINKDTGEIQFRPEFIARCDEVVVFEDLGTPEVVKILHKEVKTINTDYKDRGVSVELDNDTAQRIIAKYHVPSANGRGPRKIVKRLIRPHITNYLLARMQETIGSEKPLNDHLRIDFDGTAVTLHRIEAEVPGPDGYRVRPGSHAAPDGVQAAQAG